MGPCVKRLLLLAANERTSQMAESDFLQHLHDMSALSWSTSRLEPTAKLFVGHRCLMCSEGGGTVWATPLPLNPSLWPHMVFHSRFFGNAELEGCGLPMLPLIWFRIPVTASHRVSHLA